MNLPPPPGPAEPPKIPPAPEAAGPAGAAPPPRGPLVLGLAIFVGLLVAVGLVWRWAATPATCADADLTSERFGYCIAVPGGWRAADVTGEELPADQLFQPDGNATVMIQAIETGRGLDAFTDDVRRLQQDEGLTPTDVRQTQVDGVEARRWDATLAGGAGTIRARTLVFERDGIAWRIQFADTSSTFDEHVADLSRILESWRFR